MHSRPPILERFPDALVECARSGSCLLIINQSASLIGNVRVSSTTLTAQATRTLELPQTSKREDVPLVTRRNLEDTRDLLHILRARLADSSSAFDIQETCPCPTHAELGFGHLDLTLPKAAFALVGYCVGYVRMSDRPAASTEFCEPLCRLAHMLTGQPKANTTLLEMIERISDQALRQQTHELLFSQDLNTFFQLWRQISALPNVPARTCELAYNLSRIYLFDNRHPAVLNHVKESMSHTSEPPRFDKFLLYLARECSVPNAPMTALYSSANGLTKKFALEERRLDRGNRIARHFRKEAPRFLRCLKGTAVRRENPDHTVTWSVSCATTGLEFYLRRADHTEIEDCQSITFVLVCDYHGVHARIVYPEFE
eukprot:m.83584 g.83584  ORF g.83584 m.83584 type:complete len:371 (-) comp50823_c0_seq3:80-1192(-)